MSLFSRGGLSHPDFLISLYFIIMFLFGIALNLITILHNYNGPLTVPKMLFRWIAFIDIVICASYATEVLFVTLPQGNPRCCTVSDSNYTCELVWGENVTTAMFAMLITEPVIRVCPCFTAILAGCRYVQVRYPFYLLTRNQVKIAMAVSAIYCYGSKVLQIVIFNWPDRKVVFTYAKIMIFTHGPSAKELYLANITLVVLVLSFSVIVSLLTLAQLRRKNLCFKERTHQNRSVFRYTLKITLMNLTTYLGILICLIIVGSSDLDRGSYPKFTKGANIAAFAALRLSVMLFSVLNPFIFLILTDDVFRQSHSFLFHQFYRRTKTRLLIFLRKNFQGSSSRKM